MSIALTTIKARLSIARNYFLVISTILIFSILQRCFSVHRKKFLRDTEKPLNLRRSTYNQTFFGNPLKISFVVMVVPKSRLFA